MCPEFQGQCPRPAASGCGRPCALSCAASRVIIFPPPVLLTFPGPILSTCPQQTLLGTPGIPEGEAGTSSTSRAAPIPPSGRFSPKFISGPVLGLDSREASEGGAGSWRRSRGARVAPSEGLVPKSGSGRCCYVFSSRWIHPCRRSGGGSRQPAGNAAEERIPELEKPGMENEDEAEEEKEALEV